MRLAGAALLLADGPGDHVGTRPAPSTLAHGLAQPEKARLERLEGDLNVSTATRGEPFAEVEISVGALHGDDDE